MNSLTDNILNRKSFKRPIVKLDEKIANQIAAGEVIERPAAIVKELVENSIDAGANSIEILVSQGGKSIIQVKDDGWGISKDELPTAVCRHATSKLIDNEISNVNTYGFRGEALPSIGCSGRLNIKSKIDERNKARSDKNYELADKIRQDLFDKGILIEDKDGTTSWKLK